MCRGSNAAEELTGSKACLGWVSRGCSPHFENYENLGGGLGSLLSTICSAYVVKHLLNEERGKIRSYQ